MEIGTIVTKENYTKAAIWCNQNGAHIEKVEGKYIIVVNPAPTEPTLEEQVAKLEAETGLTRIMREMVLAEGSGASEYVKAKAQEIEALAEQLRTGKEDLQVEEVVISETENTTEKVEGWE